VRALGLIVLTTTWLSAATALAQTGEPILPPGYGTVSSAPGQGVPYATVTTPVAGTRVEIREHEESIRGLWIPGLVGLPLSWILTWSVATATTRLDGDAIEFSYIPLIGPWLMLGQPLNGEEGYYIAAGVFQGASALALILGLSIRRTVRQQVIVAGDLDVDFDFGPLPGGGAAAATIRF
jgi:hypothetical protein